MKWHRRYTQSIFVAPHFGNSSLKTALQNSTLETALCETALQNSTLETALCETEIDANLHRNPHKMLLSSQFSSPHSDTNGVSQEQVERGGHLHILLGARKRDSDRFQGGEGSFENRGQGERAEQLTEKEEPSLLLVQVQKLTTKYMDEKYLDEKYIVEEYVDENQNDEREKYG